MDRYVVISSDCHAGAPADGYRPYLEQRYWQDYEQFIAGYGVMSHEGLFQMAGGEIFREEQRAEFGSDEGVRPGERSGAWQADKRIADLEADGTVGEVIFPDFQNRNEPPFNVLEGPGYYEPEMQLAGARSYNRWLAEMCSQHPDRMRGVAILPTILDVASTVKEIEWAAQNGLRGGILLPLIPDHAKLPQYHHPMYEPIWSVCEELDMPVHTHATSGTPDYGMVPGARAVFHMEVTWFAHRPLYMLLWGGAFERHPKLKFVLTEQGTDWIPAVLKRMDGEATRFAYTREGLSLMPSEYWARQCFVGSTALKRHECELRYDIGVDKIMWGSDYPHLEGTWPHTADRLKETFHGVSTEEVRLMVGETAAHVYNFDRDALAPVVETVGPRFDDL